MSITIVGLTGQSGSGKTTVSNLFIQNGFYHINCDLIAREVTSVGSECLSDLVQEFSECILDSDKTLNRRALGSIVFTSRKKLECLNQLIFPYIVKRIEDTILILEKDGHKLVLLDAPTLFESGADSLCSIIVSVVADYQLRINRIVRRDNLTLADAQNRLKSQHSTEFFINNSDFVIDNNGDSDKLKMLVQQTIIFIRERLNGN